MPQIAIREVLVNSLAHRDYAVLGAKIDVDIYDARLEITNPGASLVPINQLDSTGSITRNLWLMSFFRDIGLAEEKARGIWAIKESLRRASLKQPLFENIPGQFFEATIYSSLLASAADKPWLKRMANLEDLSQNQINALLVFKHGQYRNLTNADYRRINNLNQIRGDIWDKDWRRVTLKSILWCLLAQGAQ